MNGKERKRSAQPALSHNGVGEELTPPRHLSNQEEQALVAAISN